MTRSHVVVLFVVAACGGSSSGAKPDGPKVDASGIGVEACAAHGCNLAPGACGVIDDGCGQSLTCGCPDPLTCDAQTTGQCGISEANRVCNAGGWCWEYPLPFGMDFSAIWGVSSSDLWVSGKFGTLLHYDGAHWSAIASNLTGPVHSIWGADSTHVWFADGVNLGFWNGATVAAPAGLPPPVSFQANALAGTSATDLWVSDVRDEKLWHWDGAIWKSYNSPTVFTPTALLALSPTFAWGTRDGTWIAWDGTAWTSLTGAPNDAYMAWGTSPTDIWEGGGFHVSHWNGTAWTQATGTPDGAVAIAGSSSSNVWAVSSSPFAPILYRLASGGGFQAITDPVTEEVAAGYEGLWVSPQETWAIGGAGRVVSFDGASWTKRSGFGEVHGFEHAAAIAANEVWIAGDGIVRLRDGVATVEKDLSFDSPAIAIGGTSTTDVWFVASNGDFVQWNGSTWHTTSPTAGTLPAMPYAAYGSGSDVYLVGGVAPGAVFKWSGTAWAPVTSLAQATAGALGAIGFASPADIWVGAADGSLFHFDNVSWTKDATAPTTAAITSIWVSPTGSAWVVSGGQLYRKTGTQWTTIGAVGSAVSGTSDTDVWTVAPNGSPGVQHWTGTTWTPDSTGAGQTLGAVLATPTAVYAAGLHSAILRKPR